MEGECVMVKFINHCQLSLIDNIGNTIQGVPNHLFLGHGPNQEDFEKRDFGTTNNMFFE